MTNKKKTKILLCWGYHRKSWLHAFRALQDDFEFYYLFYISKPENERNVSGSDNILYWSDFKSAQDLLNKIKPEKIVFMGIEGINAIALNVVAQKRNIETLVLQHGMFHTYSDYLKLAKEDLNVRKKTNNFSRSAIEIDRAFLFRFFLRSVAFVNPLAIAYMLKLQYLKRKYVEVEAVKNAPSKFRTASKYVVFSKSNASIYSERDKIDESNLVEIGNPEMDAYFAFAEDHQNVEGNYYLLIDQPWSELKEFSSPGFGITNEQMNQFYVKLAEFAETKSAKLKIKLHPYSYDSDFFISHPNIEYKKDTDLIELIMSSRGVFGYSSTLLLPALYFKRCCVFRIWEESSFQNMIEKLGFAQVLDYHTFSTEDIDFESIEKSRESMDEFVKRYFYKADGKAIQRLKEILQANTDE